ncbi:hypothetical protein LSAT2_020041 [Lamellibrachia satsuma]|nr:hypothetical protein LSAT2_020041 [Lamellibrachia satsuma]
MVSELEGWAWRVVPVLEGGPGEWCLCWKDGPGEWCLSWKGGPGEWCLCWKDGPGEWCLCWKDGPGEWCLCLKSRPGEWCLSWKGGPGKWCLCWKGRPGKWCLCWKDGPGEWCLSWKGGPGEWCLCWKDGPGEWCLCWKDGPGEWCLCWKSRPGEWCLSWKGGPGKWCLCWKGERGECFVSVGKLSLGTSFEKEVSSAVLDLTGDEDSTLRKMKNQLKWDRKKKKFVRESGKDEGKKKVKTESGTWISASYKSNLYKEWLEKNKVVEFGDDDDEAGSHGNRSQFGRQGRRRGRGGVGRGGIGRGGTGRGGAGGRRGGRPELKSTEQILKARQHKAKVSSFQKQRHDQRLKRKAHHSRGGKK